VYRLIGAPPGYVGYDEVTPTRSRKTKTIFCNFIDEIMLNPDTFNILLQVSFDEVNING
jgi:ATP-dependent Clp protease ATP-binding subunit ClpA